MKAGKVYVEHGVIIVEILDDEGRIVDTYGIFLSECKTPRDVCDWVRQLGQKAWVTKETLVEFAQCLLREHA